MGLVRFCLPLRPVLVRVREEYELQGVEAYSAHLDDVAIAVQEITPGAVGMVSFLQREMVAGGIHLDPGNKTVTSTPKGHVPVPDRSLLAGVGVCMAKRGGDKDGWGARRH